MSHGPWHAREDEAGDFSPVGFLVIWVFFNPVFFTVPLLSQSCPGALAKLPGSCSVPVPAGFGVVLGGAG